MRDMHNEVEVGVVGDVNILATRDLKRYTLPKDQTICGPIRKLLIYILTEIGLFYLVVLDHIEGLSDVPHYCSTLPSPTL